MSVDLDLERQLRAAFVGSEAGDWAAVQARTRRRSARRLRRRGTGGLLAAALTLVVASQALGLGPQLLGGPAKPPKAVARAFSSLRVDMRTVHLGAEATTPDGRPARLWVADPDPRTCFALQIGSGAAQAGCGGIVSGPEPGRKGAAPLYVAGVGPAEVARARLRFADGDSMTVPANAGSWLAVVPLAHVRYGHDLEAVDLLRGDGTLVSTDRMGPAVPPAQPSGPWQVAARFGGRPLRIAPSAGGGACVELLRADGVGIEPERPQSVPTGVGFSDLLQACGPPPSDVRAWLVRIAPQGAAGQLVLVGRTPRGATSVELRFAKHPLQARVVRGVYFRELPQTAGRTLTRLVARNAAGRVVANRAVKLPRAGVFVPAWHGARYKDLVVGPFNTGGYVLGPLSWPPSP